MNKTHSNEDAIKELLDIDKSEFCVKVEVVNEVWVNIKQSLKNEEGKS